MILEDRAYGDKLGRPAPPSTLEGAIEAGHTVTSDGMNHYIHPSFIGLWGYGEHIYSAKAIGGGASNNYST